STGTTLYAYDLFDRLIGIDYPNGNFIRYGYDNVGNVTDLQYGNWLTLYLFGVYTYIHYEFDEDNRIASVRNVSTGDTTTYTYDALDRLDTVRYPDGRFVDYDYDTFGNRTRMAETNGATVNLRIYSYDSDSRLLSITLNGSLEETFTYDKTGNLIQRFRVTD